jgi:hypothetical protein
MAGTSAKAKITTLASGVTQIRHTEYFRDVVGTTDLVVTSDPINPGNESLFPWLASIAVRYESYQFQSLVFRYETQASTSTDGTVVLSVDYNPEGQVPSSKQQLLAMDESMRTPSWGSISHISQRYNLTKRKSYYVRNGDPVTDADLYDTGSFILGVIGTNTTAGIGELYVDYVIDLITPVLNAPGIPMSSGYLAGTQFTSYTTYIGPFANTYSNVCLEAVAVAGGAYSIGVSGVSVGGIQFLQTGYWMVEFQVDAINTAVWTASHFGVVTSGNIASISNTTLGGTTMVDPTGRYATSQYAVHVTSVSERLNSIADIAFYNLQDTTTGYNVATTCRIMPYNPTNQFLLSNLQRTFRAPSKLLHKEINESATHGRKAEHIEPACDIDWTQYHSDGDPEKIICPEGCKTGQTCKHEVNVEIRCASDSIPICEQEAIVKRVLEKHFGSKAGDSVKLVHPTPFR